jgi:APA family basic amino acid/polyamine antiporter
MASNRDLPGFLSAVHPRHRVPHRAELLVGVIVATAVAIADLRSAIGFSSFAVLAYYAIANAAAWTESVIAGGAVLAAGVLVHLARRRRPPETSSGEPSEPHAIAWTARGARIRFSSFW